MAAMLCAMDACGYPQSCWSVLLLKFAVLLPAVPALPGARFSHQGTHLSSSISWMASSSVVGAMAALVSRQSCSQPPTFARRRGFEWSHVKFSEDFPTVSNFYM